VDVDMKVIISTQNKINKTLLFKLQSNETRLGDGKDRIDRRFLFFSNIKSIKTNYLVKLNELFQMFLH
jgi:hypothetical protein